MVLIEFWSIFITLVRYPCMNIDANKIIIFAFIDPIHRVYFFINVVGIYTITQTFTLDLQMNGDIRCTFFFLLSHVIWCKRLQMKTLMVFLALFFTVSTFKNSKEINFCIIEYFLTNNRISFPSVSLQHFSSHKYNRLFTILTG